MSMSDFGAEVAMKWANWLNNWSRRWEVNVEQQGRVDCVFETGYSQFGPP
jgi:hypothetical protein